ncbi:aminopeptidase [Constantimarinum furrinae]|uniref:Aminopeptidase n=2 Tax=Constantimarinum furrinae TaxID=2562285 RepID=A0A7G8PS17_9FLAO|nr:aminopeptidase [Constantimarinum furrinae]
MQEDVTFLADDALKGRQTGTEGEQLAAEYIAKRFEELGLEPKGDNQSYFQEFTFRPSSNPHEQAEFADSENDSTQTGINVVGYLDHNAASTIVIGAHYDHLGLGGEGSLYREGEAIHNGADDNASGVAVMLDLARRLSENKKNNYLFIGFSGEEMGLLGSSYFVKNSTIDLEQINYMINMDMVGRLNTERTVAVHGVGTSPVFKQTLFASNTFDLNIAEHESGIGPSDHTSFYLADIPVLHFFTGQHSDYHKPGDDADKLNYDGMQIISDYIYGVINELSNQGKLAFRKTKNESEVVPEFKVTLGVVPDYLFTGKGMRIDGVSEDKPAIKAGLKKGDIVVKMGEYDVTDMMSYMKTLSKFEKGEKTIVTVKRGEQPLEVEVEF